MNKENRIWEIISSVAVYVLALFVVAINISLSFDNVVWGDEAFSVNTAQNTFSGIMEILYYYDNHPPLHYFWMKVFGDVFGHTIYVYHWASLVPFIISIILVATLFKKQFGNIPTMFLVVILGLGYFCIEYNLEIRMYSLAFLGVLMTFYCAYRVISEGKKRTYTGMVLWALLAAYSHYYGLVTVGILMFMTTVAVCLKNRGKSWIKGTISMVAFLVCYAPWLYCLFNSIRNVSRSWWMTDILSLRRTISMILGGHGFNRWILALLAVLCSVLLVAESEVLGVKSEDGKRRLRIKKPTVNNWSDETVAVVVGLATIIGTVGFAYFICYVFKPMLAQRYMYPLSAVTFVMLAVAMSRVFKLLHKYKYSHNGLVKSEKIIKGISLVVLALFIGIGLGNFNVYRDIAIDQENKTKATLSLIGEPEEDTMFVTNGVKHLGWTIFPCYFPETEFLNGNCFGATKDKFWYFNPTPISEEDIKRLTEMGYNVISYGQMQISQYVFSLYYMEK